MQKKGHATSARRVVGYAYCHKCGLLYLKNAATRKALAAPCKGDDD